jgi:CDP-6-deoxy-D-xylo-4-hexulose-3-dehydrase
MMVVAEIFGPGEVIVPPLTWVSDISAVIRAGHKPVFADINSQTLALDIGEVGKLISKKTRAIFLTHVLGLNGLNNEFLELVNFHGIPLIEDVCESHGATFGSKKLGTFGLASNFSFYFAHHMTTIEGGMICTNDKNFYDIARMMRSHGLVRESIFEKTKNYYAEQYPDLNQDFVFAYPSHNMRSTELNAVIGISQLQSLDKKIKKRSENFEYFLSSLDSTIFETNLKIEGNSNYALTLILKEKSFHIRDRIEDILRIEGVEFRRGMAGGGNQLRQPYLKNIAKGLDLGSFPVVEHCHFFSWYIGNNDSITKFQIDKLCKLLSAQNLLRVENSETLHKT